MISNCLNVMKVVMTAAGAMIGLIPGIVIYRILPQNPAPSRVALSYSPRSMLCNAPSMVAIIKGSAIHRFKGHTGTKRR